MKKVPDRSNPKLSYNNKDKRLHIEMDQSKFPSVTASKNIIQQKRHKPECIADLNSPQILYERPLYIHKRINLRQKDLECVPLRFFKRSTKAKLREKCKFRNEKKVSAILKCLF